MSANPECDLALLRASMTDPKAAKLLKDLLAGQARAAKTAVEDMEWNVLESDIPAPGHRDWGEIAPTARAAGKALGAEPGEAAQVWNKFKQARVALMLSNGLTHVKNVGATGGNVLVVRPLEEAMAIALSKRRGADAQSFKELYYFMRGGFRGATDTISLIKTLGKQTMLKGASNFEDATKALQESGYNPALARSKVDLVHDMRAAEEAAKPENIAVKGAKYLGNAMFGSQFSALQMEDLFFKMISHRSKVEQLLSRKGMKEGHYGDSLDEYVSRNWDEMSARNKAGKFETDPESIEKRGVTQASEDTYTQEMQTDLGRWMSGQYKTDKAWKRVASEGMQVLAPFRSIYVNLMRQAFSRRLLPFWDDATQAELSGKMGAEAQDLARGRVAGAYTLLAATAAVVYSGAVKVHTPDSVDPEVRELQNKMTGKVGNTMEVMGFYYPLDAFASSLAILLTLTAAAMEGINELNYRYSDDDDFEEMTMRAMHPFMQAVTDGPWVKEYLDFLATLNQKIQYGDVGGLGDLMASVLFSPMKPPKWTTKLMGYDPHIKTTDGFVDKILTEWTDHAASYGHERNMFGRRILPLERLGPGSEFPWFGGEKEITDFLKVINYDKHYPSNARLSVSGDGNGKNGVEEGHGSVKLDKKMRDQFELYVGESRAGESGRTMAEDLKVLMNNPAVYDTRTGELKAREIIVRTEVKDLHSKRRAVAKRLIQYNPTFGIREQQIESFYKQFLKNGGSQGDANKIRENMDKEMNRTRTDLQGYF